QNSCVPAFLIKQCLISEIRVIRGSESGLVAQLDVPVSKIDKMSPALVLRRAECYVQERSPLRPLRFANQSHLGFVRTPIAVASVARDARADNIFPGCIAAAIPRQHMIEIQIVAIESLAAVLPRVLVALENVMACKFHFLLWKPIEKQEHDHAR